MAATKRTRFQRSSDRAKISRMYLACRTQDEIASEIGVSQQQISYDLRSLREEWRNRSLASIEERANEEIARLDLLESEYWNGWNRSKQVGNGNPAFLKGVIQCIAMRCRILGLNAPDKQQIQQEVGIWARAQDYATRWINETTERIERDTGTIT